MYIAQNIQTKQLYYSKGADKLATLIGISPKTIVRNATNTFSTKVYNGYVFAKCEELRNSNRGTDIQ